MKKYIAEGLGTALLTLVVGLSLKIGFVIATPILAALVLGLFVYSMGHVSGVHINPAVTIGLWSIEKIKTNEAVMYIVSQVIGSALAMYVISQSVTGPSLVASGALPVIFAEFLGTFFFTFGIASVVYGKVHDMASGLVIGGSLLLGITVSALLGANGVLNPAVAYGIGSLGLAYIIGPIVGSIAGMNAYKYLAH